MIIFGLQSDPLVVPGKKLTHQDVARVKRVMRLNDPRKIKAGQIKRLSLTERDLNLFLDYALTQSRGTKRFCARINLHQKLMHIRFTYKLPSNPFGAYLNMLAILSQSPENESIDSISFDKLKIGVVPLPGWLVNIIVKYAFMYLEQYDDYQSIVQRREAIKKIQLNKKNMTIVYQIEPDAMRELQAQGRKFLMSENDQKRLSAYNAQIGELSRSLGNKSISITKALQSLFRIAREKTTASNNPIAENRALILALTMNSTGLNMNKILGIKKSNRSNRLRLTLRRRHDLAKHFLVSAAIAVSGGSGLANLAGLFKEMDDSRGGSGFSFADLAADRAGVKLAETAISSSGKARRLQQLMSNCKAEDDFMPKIDTLPEGIMELQFKRKYKDLDSNAYRMIDREIEHRITACSIYR